MANIFKNKNILVTGGTGSIGSEIVRKVLQYEPKVVRVFSNDEDGQFSLEQELQNYSNVRFLIGDVKDKDRLRTAIEGIDVVFHSAALKHVPLCEYNPFEAVKTNVIGTQNLIEVAVEEEVDKFITISTDKAVKPVNVLGTTKLLAERLTISANYYKGLRETVFSSVRFGNVLSTRGSVVPLFVEQIEKGGPVTITDPDMTRFVMSISKAVGLVLKAVELAQGGEIFIFKMPALRISDLAEVMVEELAPKYGYKPEDIEIQIVGRRPAEKLYEELMTEDEAMEAYEDGEMFVVLPQTFNITGELPFKLGESFKKAREAAYSSRGEGVRLLAKEEIKQLLRETSQEPY